MDYKEPTELEMAIMDREQMRLCPFGPLTRQEAEHLASYERYCEEQDAEYEVQERAGGRTVCPQCGQRSVKHRTVCTYGRPGVEGSDYSGYAQCENCDYKELAG